MISRKIHLLCFLIVISAISVYSQKQTVNLNTVSSANDISQDSILSIYEDKSGFLWFGTQDGLNRYDGFKFDIYKYSENNSGSLPSNFITSISGKSEGNLWLGTRTDGISKFTRSKRTFKNFRHNPKDKGSLSDNRINQVLVDKSGKLWVATEYGLNLLNKESGKFQKFFTGSADSSSLSSSKIISIYEDKSGRIWISGYSNGISIFDPPGKSFSHLNNSNSKLNSNTTSVVFEDSKGIMWIGTMERGINKYNPKTKTFKYYTEANGLINNTINYISGFNIVEPAGLRQNINRPKVVLTSLEILNKAVAIGEGSSPLKESLLVADEITLEYWQSVFTLSFAALDFTIPENNNYAYKLEGFDEDWNYVGTERKATYKNLDPGTYIFRVIASNNNNLWNKEGTSLKIIINPPFWMTWWFRTTMILILITLVYLLFRFKMRTVQKQKAELEKLVNERTSQILKQTRDVEYLNLEFQKQTEILLQQKNQEYNARLLAEEMKKEAERANRAKSTFLATMSHEIRTPMNGVLGMATLLSETRLNKAQFEYTKAIQQSGESLLNVINDVLDFSKIESGNFELDEHNFVLRRCIEDVFLLFESRIRKTGVIMTYSIDGNIPENLRGDSSRLRQILINLIGNAAKFTESGEIVVRVSRLMNESEDLRFKFEVSDTGIGIPEEQHSNLFKAFHQLDSSITRQHGGTGLGLVICQRLIKMMGGHITIDSKKGEGTRVTFNILCKPGENTENAYEACSILSDPKLNGSSKLINTGFASEYPFNILVAEDNLMNQKVILMVLKNLGYAPDLANDGEEAMEMMKLKNYDLILMDIQMPKVDGLEGTRLIRKLYGKSPIILALTANSAIEDREACFDAGMNDFLTKPLNIKLLILQLQEFHKNKKQRISA